MEDWFSAFHRIDSIYLLPHEGTTKSHIGVSDFTVLKYPLEINLFVDEWYIPWYYVIMTQIDWDRNTQSH